MMETYGCELETLKSVKKLRNEVKSLCEQQLPSILKQAAAKDIKEVMANWKKLTAELQQKWAAQYVLEAINRRKFHEVNMQDGTALSDLTDKMKSQKPRTPVVAAAAAVDGECLSSIRQFVARLSQLDVEILESLRETSTVHRCTSSDDFHIRCADELRAHTEKHLKFLTLADTELECKRELEKWETLLKSKYLDDMQVALRRAEQHYNIEDNSAKALEQKRSVLSEIRKHINEAVAERLHWFHDEMIARIDKYKIAFVTLNDEARARARDDEAVPLLCQYLPAEENVQAAIESIMQEACGLQDEVMHHATESARLACKVHLLRNGELYGHVCRAHELVPTGRPSGHDFQTPVRSKDQPSITWRDIPTDQLLKSP